MQLADASALWKAFNRTRHTISGEWKVALTVANSLKIKRVSATIDCFPEWAVFTDVGPDGAPPSTLISHRPRTRFPPQIMDVPAHSQPRGHLREPDSRARRQSFLAWLLYQLEPASLRGISSALPHYLPRPVRRFGRPGELSARD